MEYLFLIRTIFVDQVYSHEAVSNVMRYRYSNPIKKNSPYIDSTSVSVETQNIVLSSP